jgi:hypothetical protein
MVTYGKRIIYSASIVGIVKYDQYPMNLPTKNVNIL